jgi:hypothetical protein
LGVLSAFIPKSWHHPHGARKIVRGLEPRLPDVSNALFLTFTLDREQFADPGQAFDYARPRIRKFFDRLRRGVEWEGKRYVIDAPYCVKVEFHGDDWPHFHVIFLTNRFVPGELINFVWRLGRCNVARITNDDFRYLLKYVTKNGEYPEWVLPRRRLRIFQPSHGFMKSAEDAKKQAEQVPAYKERRKRASYTIGQRLQRWKRMGLFNRHGIYRTVLLRKPFQELFDELVVPIARAKRYLGYGLIQINQSKQLFPWMIPISP